MVRVPLLEQRQGLIDFTGQEQLNLAEKDKKLVATERVDLHTVVATFGAWRG